MNTTRQGSRSISSFRPLSIYVRGNYEKLIENEKFCDVTFEVGQEKKEYHAIRALFAIHSCVFENMLYGSMMEASLDAIELRDIRPQTFEFLMGFCYGLDPELTAKNVVGILQCSDKYLIEPLKEACIEFISSISISSSSGNSSDFLQLIIELNKYKLTDMIVEIINKVNDTDNDDDDDNNNIDYEEILNNPLLMKLNKSGFESFVLKSKIFDNTLYVSKEKLWITCVKWTKMHCISRNESLRMIKKKEEDEDDDNDNDDSKSDNKENNDYLNSIGFDEDDLKICIDQENEKMILHSFLQHFDFKEMSCQFFIDYIMPLNILSTDLNFSILSSHIRSTLHIIEKYIDLNKLTRNEMNIVRHHHYMKDMDNIRFNIYNTKHSMVSGDYKRVKTKDLGKSNVCKTIVFISDIGYSSGIHRWAIKSHDSSSGYNAIGIISNYQCINDTDNHLDFYVSWPDHVIVYYTNGDIDHRKDGKKVHSISSKKKWSTGDTITVCLDCELWKLSFHKDGMMIADEINIPKNIKYFPALRCCTCKGHDYEILI